jgi:hypothetical protein
LKPRQEDFVLPRQGDSTGVGATPRRCLGAPVMPYGDAAIASALAAAYVPASYMHRWHMDLCAAVIAVLPKSGAAGREKSGIEPDLKIGHDLQPGAAVQPGRRREDDDSASTHSGARRTSSRRLCSTATRHYPAAVSPLPATPPHESGTSSLSASKHHRFLFIMTWRQAAGRICTGPQTRTSRHHLAAVVGAWCPGSSTLLVGISACCKEIAVFLLPPLRHFAVLPPPAGAAAFRRLRASLQQEQVRPSMFT